MVPKRPTATALVSHLAEIAAASTAWVCATAVAAWVCATAVAAASIEVRASAAYCGAAALASVSSISGRGGGGGGGQTPASPRGQHAGRMFPRAWTRCRRWQGSRAVVEAERPRTGESGSELGPEARAGLVVVVDGVGEIDTRLGQRMFSAPPRHGTPFARAAAATAMSAIVIRVWSGGWIRGGEVGGGGLEMCSAECRCRESQVWVGLWLRSLTSWL